MIQREAYHCAAWVQRRAPNGSARYVGVYMRAQVKRLGFGYDRDRELGDLLAEILPPRAVVIPAAAQEGLFHFDPRFLCVNTRYTRPPTRLHIDSSAKNRTENTMAGSSPTPVR